jgi:hypothetical protein
MPQQIDVPGMGVVEFPDGMTDAQIVEAIRANTQQHEPKADTPLKASHSQVQPPMMSRAVSRVGKVMRQDFVDPVMGAIKGASDIGSTILWPVDKVGLSGMTPQERRNTISGFFENNASTDSARFKAGELAANIAGTSGVGGLLAKGVRSIPLPLPKLASAIESGGFSLGSSFATSGVGKAADIITRGTGGAITGAATAGLINPSMAETGATLGLAMPIATKAASAAGKSFAGNVPKEVKDLAIRAKELGIDLPADRIANSKPMNALASSLNYVPFSGRAGTESKMYDQVSRALTRTFGQDSTNVSTALRRAGKDLGVKFDEVLKNNSINFDDQLLSELTDHLKRADSELETGAAKVIKNQVEEILSKAQNEVIDGRAAYNIKKTLDRISNRNTPEAFYARDLKKTLMGALDRSLGPEKAEGFKLLRQQYGNMLDLEGVAQRGGGISAAKLANLPSKVNPQLDELADISATFLKTRESPHGAAQRVIMGTLAAPAAYATGMVPALVGGMALGRTANTALNSNMLKGLMTGTGKQGLILADPMVRTGLISLGGRP